LEELTPILSVVDGVLTEPTRVVSLHVQHGAHAILPDVLGRGKAALAAAGALPMAETMMMDMSGARATANWAAVMLGWTAKKPLHRWKRARLGKYLR